MKFFSLIFLIFTTSLWAAPSLQIDRERIEAGKTFGLQLVVPTAEIPAERGALTLHTENGFSLLNLDSADQSIQPQMSFEDMFFGGGRNRPYKARVYTFLLKAPKKTGRINLGSITWEIVGEVQTISGNIPVNVQKSFNDEAVNVSLTPSKKTVYEGEQFYLTLGFHTYEHFAGGLNATDMSTGDDFIVHRSELSDLEFKPVPGTRNEREARTKYAWLASTKSGTLQIPSFKFKYTKVGEPKVVEENKSHGGFSMSFKSVKQEQEEAEALTPKINITVKPLPTEGKPETFTGMVGDFKFAAAFDKTELKVGEALTLSVRIEGDGIPGTIAEPKLPDFSDFRSVPPENNITKKVRGNKVVSTKEIKVFLYPKKKGEFEIPAMNYSWFNPTKKKYEEVTQGPWKITVEKGENVAETVFQTPAAQGGVIVQKQEIESLGADIRFIHSVMKAGASPKFYKNPIFLIACFACIPFYFAIVLIVNSRRKRYSNTALLRRSKAQKELKERFNLARKALAEKEGKAFFAALENGLIDYLSNLTNVEFKGLTSAQMKDELVKRNATDEEISSIEKFLEKCAFVRYAPVNASGEEQAQMLKDVEALCERLEKLK